MNYFSEINKSMKYLSKKKKTIFIGQAVEYPGTAMFNTLNGVNKSKLYELPVAEEMQMGMSLGLAMEGFIPITLYPRWNFLLLATNQIVNHLDKIKVISDKQFQPKLIIRTSVGSIKPLDPQAQHRGNFSKAFENLCQNIRIVELKDKKKIFQEYKKAFNYNGISLMVEFADSYNS
tara:strand:+ start:10983 stop:11510 length:528 start_codon:yes stop_codon:yes gene_type:complete